MSLSPWPYYDSDQIEAATSVLSSGKVNSWTGSITKAFEEEYCKNLIALIQLPWLTDPLLSLPLIWR